MKYRPVCRSRRITCNRAGNRRERHTEPCLARGPLLYARQLSDARMSGRCQVGVITHELSVAAREVQHLVEHLLSSIISRSKPDISVKSYGQFPSFSKYCCHHDLETCSAAQMDGTSVLESISNLI